MCWLLFVSGLWKDGEFGKERLLSAAVLSSALQMHHFQHGHGWAAHALVPIVPGEAEQICVRSQPCIPAWTVMVRVVLVLLLPKQGIAWLTVKLFPWLEDVLDTLEVL